MAVPIVNRVQLVPPVLITFANITTIRIKKKRSNIKYGHHAYKLKTYRYSKYIE